MNFRGDTILPIKLSQIEVLKELDSEMGFSITMFVKACAWDQHLGKTGEGSRIRQMEESRCDTDSTIALADSTGHSGTTIVL